MPTSHGWRLGTGTTVLVAAIVAGGTPMPASAHDQLLASSPATDERLASSPSEISMQFSAELLDLGAVVLVVDEQDRDWAQSEPMLNRTDVNVQLEPGMPEAGYEVRWQVVSSDGHPLSGVIPFTVGEGAPLVRDSDAGATADDASGGDSNSASVATQADREASTALRIVLIGVGGAALAVILFALITTILRRRPPGPDASRN